MLPSFYQACLQAQLSSIQFITLQMLVMLLQKERKVSIERLATLFAQPILFESRRRNLQRFLLCPKLTPQALWFPILKHWVKQHFCDAQPLQLVIDRTQWRNHNLLMSRWSTKAQGVTARLGGKLRGRHRQHIAEKIG